MALEYFFDHKYEDPLNFQTHLLFLENAEIHDTLCRVICTNKFKTTINYFFFNLDSTENDKLCLCCKFPMRNHKNISFGGLNMCLTSPLLWYHCFLIYIIAFVYNLILEVGYICQLLLQYTKASITKKISINRTNWVLFNTSCGFRVLSLSCCIAALIIIF